MREAAAWRRFFLCVAGSATGLGLLVWLFAVVVDPWGVLPLSPLLPRVPVTSSARYAYPLVARSARFDSVVIGTSTSRTLPPAALDAAFGARFANLAVNAATAREESRMLGAFLQAHAAPRFVLVGLDFRWCDMAPRQVQAEYAFPDWMYRRRRWIGYLKMFDVYAVREAAASAGVMLGWKRSRIGADGYTPFAGPEEAYDPARAHAHIVAEGHGGMVPPVGVPPDSWVFPQHALLARMLAEIPAGTRTVLFFTPTVLPYAGAPDSPSGRLWSECKRRVAALAAAHPNTVVADFMVPSAVTRDETNFWDAIHTRDIVAPRLARDLASAAAFLPAPNGDDRLLAGAAPRDEAAAR